MIDTDMFLHARILIALKDVNIVYHYDEYNHAEPKNVGMQ